MKKESLLKMVKENGYALKHIKEQDKEICLEEQDFIKESKLTVKEYVRNNGGKVISMVRFGVGEGIEKRQEDFASEVMSQIQNA